jgi:hypothetical protein
MEKIETFKEGPLRIYHASKPSDAILNLAKIAGCLGIAANLVDLGPSNFPAADLRAGTSGASVWDIGSLAKLIGLVDWKAIASDLGTSCASVILLVTDADDRHHEVLKVLSQGGVNAVRTAGRPESVGFPTTLKRLSAELSGHRYKRSRRDALAMDVNGNAGVETVMEFGQGQAAFARFQRGSSSVFIWSTFSVFDVDLPLGRELEFEEAVDEYIPAIIFLRNALGEHCWHNPAQCADIVIDDPLLTKHYGFIVFPELLRLAKELGIHLTVAFIPWNYRRTQKRHLREFFNHPVSFGICAHGCDHTRQEFRSNDYNDLLRRSYLAAERMDCHRERTGMEWDRLMVCPREEYSVEALQALADSGRFLGLVNTGCIPRDLNSKCVRGSDLLLPAEDAFFGFPIFKRHYWSDIAVFAMAAFLGKPAILVEHHDFFQDQYRSLKDFVARLKTTCPTMRWSSLDGMARQTCQRRRVASDVFEVRFFTDDFLMDNPDPEPRTIRFRRRLPLGAGIESITVNGMTMSFWREGEFVCFETWLEGKGYATVHLNRCPVPAPNAISRGWSYGAGVAARRLSSEIRDNWLSRNKSVLRVANRFVKAMRLKSSVWVMVASLACSERLPSMFGF